MADEAPTSETPVVEPTPAEAPVAPEVAPEAPVEPATESTAEPTEPLEVPVVEPTPVDEEVAETVAEIEPKVPKRKPAPRQTLVQEEVPVAAPLPYGVVPDASQMNQAYGQLSADVRALSDRAERLLGNSDHADLATKFREFQELVDSKVAVA